MKYIVPLLLGLLLTGCKQEALLTGLDQIQANEVIALLHKNNIQASKTDVSKSGFSVSVSPTDFATAVDLMATHNLPSRPRVEISSFFPSDAFVSSPRAEVARIYSGIEQRLEQTLNQMNGVVSSRVHVSYDMNSTETDKNNHPVHLSALLSVKELISSETSVIADVKRLLKNSFSNVDYENISVVLTSAPDTQQYEPVKISTNNNYKLLLFILIGLGIAGGMCITLYLVSHKVRKLILSWKGSSQ